MLKIQEGLKFLLMSKRSESKYRDWANLPTDILHTISSMLMQIRDYKAFGKLCTSWMAARAPPSKIPCLLYFPKLDDYSKHYKQLTLHADLSNIDDFSLSGLYFPHPPSFWRCISSQDGWLITAHEVHMVSLFNPLTAQLIKLPNYLYYVYFIRKAVVMWPCQTDDALIVILLTFDEGRPIAFARINSDKKWILKSTSKKNPLYRDICCIDRKVFTLGSDGGVYAINLKKDSYRAVEIISEYSSSVSAENRFMLTDFRNYSNLIVAGGFYKFMVKFGKHILYIIIDCCGGNSGIKKVDIKKQTCVWLKDLGGCSLFLGNFGSVLVSAEENIGRKGNVVYFQRWQECSNDKFVIGVLDMEDRSYKTIELSDRRHSWHYPVWFAPSPLHLSTL